MKLKRQEEIMRIIAEREVETQEQLMEALAERGFTCTQRPSPATSRACTWSRNDGGGNYKYVVSGRRAVIGFAGRLRTIFRESVTSFDSAQNIVVIKTMPGLAGAAGAALDGMELSAMVGSLAGDDTVLLIMRDAPPPRNFAGRSRRCSGNTSMSRSRRAGGLPCSRCCILKTSR
jgi:transcriptional regulator of arginine metabolism